MFLPFYSSIYFLSSNCYALTFHFSLTLFVWFGVNHVRFKTPKHNQCKRYIDMKHQNLSNCWELQSKLQLWLTSQHWISLGTVSLSLSPVNTVFPNHPSSASSLFKDGWNALTILCCPFCLFVPLIFSLPLLLTPHPFHYFLLFSQAVTCFLTRPEPNNNLTLNELFCYVMCFTLL